MDELIIPTTELVKNNYFLELSIKNNAHYLIFGSSGTGKSISIINKLR